MASKYQYWKKDALIAELQKYCSNEEIEKMTRVQMINKLDQVNSTNILESATPEPELFLEKEETISDSFVEIAENEPKAMLPTHPEWTDHVLAFFHKDELIEGHPKCDGLRRVFKILVGEIISSDVDVLQVPVSTNANRATVKVTVKYLPHSRPDVTIPYLVSDAADCFIGNTVAPYSNYPVSTAATMAEGRALRKALGIRTVSFEEVQSADSPELKNMQEAIEQSNPITDTQKNAISNIAKMLKIEVPKVLQYFATEFKSKQSIELLTYIEGQSLLKKLNAYHRGPDDGGEIIPDELYQPVQ